MPFAQTVQENDLLVHVLDVGKAEAILIESPQASVLVDCGTAAEAETVVRYLDARGIENLDAVWISHPDSDHIGGLSAVLQAVSAECIVETPVLESALAKAEADACRTVQAEPGQSFRYGNFTMEVLAPLDAYADTNDCSIVFRLIYGDFSMLFCGDIGERAERDLLESGAGLSSDVLKVAHHGSASSTSAEFLEAVGPEYAVISAGEDRNNLPRNAVLKRLDDQNVRVFRTDRDGTVVFSTDGSRIQIQTENHGLTP
ncbi:MAG: ComEC/Rec2 family competence protein [Hominenteromicrobium sp.]